MMRASFRCRRSTATWSSTAADSMPWYAGRPCCRFSKRWTVARRSRDGPLRFPVQFVARPTAEAAARLHGPDRIGRDRGRRRRDGACHRCQQPRARDPDVRRRPAACRPARRRDHRARQANSTFRAATCWSIGFAAPVISRDRRRDPCAGWRARRWTPRRRYLLRHTTREVSAKVERIDYLWNVSTQSREPAPAALAHERHRPRPSCACAAGICRPLRGQPCDRKLHSDRRSDARHRRCGDGPVTNAAGSSISSARARARRTC